MSLRKNIPIFCLAIAAVVAGSGRALAQDPPAFLTFNVENDRFASDRDRHYTNGLRLAYGFARGSEPAALQWLSQLSALRSARGNALYEISLSQHMYTPDDIGRTALIADDRPYAGWLHAEIAATVTGAGRSERIALSAGVIGPASLSDHTQDLFHDIAGIERPRGWRNQLPNEPALVLTWQRNRFVPIRSGERIQIDFVPKAGAALGNVFIHAAAGGSLRFASHLSPVAEAFRMHPGLSGPARFDFRPGHIDWVVHIGAEGRLVGRNLFLDGSTFRASHSVASKAAVADLIAGAALIFGNFSRPVSLSYTFVWRSREFKGQPDASRFASLQLGIAF